MSQQNKKLSSQVNWAGSTILCGLLFAYSILNMVESKTEVINYQNLQNEYIASYAVSGELDYDVNPDTLIMFKQFLDNEIDYTTAASNFSDLDDYNKIANSLKESDSELGKLYNEALSLENKENTNSKLYSVPTIIWGTGTLCSGIGLTSSTITLFKKIKKDKINQQVISIKTLKESPNTGNIENLNFGYNEDISNSYLERYMKNKNVLDKNEKFSIQEEIFDTEIDNDSQM